LLEDAEVEIFDISQTLFEGMAVWPGDPEFKQRWVQRIKDGNSSNLSCIELGIHTGTHIDAPLHVDDTGGDAAGISLHNCIGPVRVIEIVTEDCIRPEHLSYLDWQGVERVLFKTRNDAPSERPFDPHYIFLHHDAAEFLAEKLILLAGTDAPSIDAFDNERLSSHRVLTNRGITIVEGVRLAGVEPGDYGLICLPLKLAGLDGSPVRAVLWR
jgi:arylformamidase